MINCFDIGGSFLKYGTVDAMGRLNVIEKVPTPTHNFAEFAQTLSALTARGPVPEAPISIALPGVVDPDSGVVTCANIPCVDGLSAAQELSRRLNRDVVLANDADCFALAEATLGAGQGHRIVFAAILGTGVGGAVVIGGKLLVGTGGLTGEWGHSPWATEPLIHCGCGLWGCLDTVGGARGLERIHKHLHGVDLTSHAIVEAWIGGDLDAARTIDRHVELVSTPLAMVVNVLGPSIVPVGGGLSNVPALIERIDETVRSRILARRSTPLVVPAQCSSDPGLVGAGLLGMQTFSLERD